MLIVTKSVNKIRICLDHLVPDDKEVLKIHKDINRLQEPA